MAAKNQFKTIFDIACERKGGKKPLLSLISNHANEEYVRGLGDDRFLSEFTKKVFQSGFVWRVVENKWFRFEEVFKDFGIRDVLMMSDELLEALSTDTRIIRHYKKIQSIKDNAYMIHEVRESHKTFASFIADWPGEDIIGLWHYLKTYGSRLGGNTGPYALRALGKDTFLFTQDVEKYLRETGVFSGGIHSKRSHLQIQEFFNGLVDESGWSLSELSQLIAYSNGDNTY